LVPSQVASPPFGGSHAEHEVPHVLGSLLRTQVSPHWCVPEGQSQVPFWQLPPSAAPESGG